MTVLKLAEMTTVSGGRGGGTNITIYNQANATATASNSSGSKSQKGS